MNNKWTDEEMILTLYIYLTHNHDELYKSSKFLIDFCERLNRYTGNSRTTSSIEMRISNYKSVDPNYPKIGLDNGGKKVKEIWDNYHDKMDYLKNIYDSFVNKTMLEITAEAQDELEDIANKINNNYININLEEKDAYIESIINVRNNSIQKVFRNNLIMEFNQKCALCNINYKDLLIASHILPYSKCINKKDMINHNNGLLLCPIHDALFDKYLISFDCKGQILISKNISEDIYSDLNINKKMKINKECLNEERKKFLEEHKKMLV